MIMQKSKILGCLRHCILTVCCLLQFSAYAAANTPADRLQQRLNNLKSMTARFKEVVRADGRTVSRSRGTMALQRPGRFRWHTLSPMEQLVVADGKDLWVYDVELEQVTVKKQQKGIGGTPGLFLSGYDDTVSRDFDVKEDEHSGHRVDYDMRSKSKKDNFQRVKMVFDDDKLIKLVLYDQLGQITIVDLYHVRTNPKIKPSQFSFKPPKGVDIIRNS